MNFLALLSGIYKSFYSADFYRDVAAHWRARSFVYLLIVLVVCWFAICVVMVAHQYRFLNTSLHEMSGQMPVIHIEKGVASAETKEPVLIKLPDAKKAFVVIDTHGQYKEFEKSPAIILVSQQSIKVKHGKAQIETYQYSDKMSGIYTADKLQQLIPTLLKWIMPFLFMFMFTFGLIVAYIYRFIQVLLYALIGMIFTRILGRKLDYVALINLAIVAITPAMVLATVLCVGFGVSVATISLFPLYFLISMLYLFFAIKSN